MPENEKLNCHTEVAKTRIGPKPDDKPQSSPATWVRGTELTNSPSRWAIDDLSGLDEVLYIIEV